MEKTLLDFVTEKTRALIAAPTCCSQLKAVAEDWLNAAGTAQEAEATRRYVAEMEADIMPRGCWPSPNPKWEQRSLGRRTPPM